MAKNIICAFYIRKRNAVSFLLTSLFSTKQILINSTVILYINKNAFKISIKKLIISSRTAILHKNVYCSQFV